MSLRLLFALLSVCVGCERPSCAPAAHEAHRGVRYAVVSSDYGSTAIALLDGEGALLDEAFLDSGSVTPRIVAALSGDVVLPSAPLGDCRLAIVDRFGTDVVTFTDPCAGAILGQVDVGATFRANPQDVVAWDETHVLISRHERNPDPDAPPLERGNDVLRVDWRAGVIRQRYALGALDRTSDDGVATIARPKRMVVLQAGPTRRVLIGLARLSADFGSTSEGAVAALDPSTSELTPLALGPMTSCDEVEAVPGEPALALVTCAGDPFTDEEGRRPSAGLATVRLGADGGLSVEHRWGASEHPGAPVYNTASVSIDATRALAVAMGDLVAGVDDRAALLDLAAGTATPLFTAESAFVLGEGSYDVDSGRLLVPDASIGAVRRFTFDGRTLSASEPEPLAGCRGLPPREVRRVR